MTTDSLTTLVNYADSLPLAHLPVASEATGIPSLTDPLIWATRTVPAFDSLAHASSAAEIFGNASQLANETTQHLASPSSFLYLSDNLLYKLVVLGCFIGLCLLTYYFRSYFRTLFNLFRSKLYVEKLLDEQSYLFDLFLRTTTACGLLLCSIAAIRFADLFAGQQIVTLLPYGIICSSSIILWGIAILIALFQYGILKLSGDITLSSDFTNRLLQLKQLLFSIATLLLAPTILLFALTPGTAGTLLGYILAGEIIGFVLLLLYQTWRLFIEQNISILQWILYLCAVEIFPISFLIVVLSKNW